MNFVERRMSSLLKLVFAVMCFLRCICSQGLQVSISTSPEAPPFPAATWIALSCDVNTTLPVTYNWTIYQCDDTVLATFDDLNNPGEFSIRVRSTPNICLGDINCAAVDFIGQTGEAIWRIREVTGAGLWGTTQPISNNSALVADALGAIASIDCHSASTQTNIGQWVSPSGNDITFDTTDDFDVLFMNGDFLSYSRLQLVPGTSFTSANEGVYSCLIPDENGIQQNVHVGIYSNGYQGTLQIPFIQRYSQSPLIIECVTTGLPATTAIWAKLPTVLSDDDTYQIVQVLTDAVSTTYSHMLAIDQSIEEARGLYYCLFQNELTGPDQSSSGPMTSAVIHFFSLYLPGDVEALICTPNGADIVQWRNGDTNELVSASNTIEIRVNDSLHHTPYICLGYSGTTATLVALLQFTVIVNVPDTALEVTATETTTPMVGSSYGVVCLAAKSISGLINDPVPVWLDSNGNEVTAGGGVSLNIGSPAELTLLFSPLQTSNSGLYMCQASLMSPALTSPLVETVPFTVTTQIPPPAVTVVATDSGPYYAGSSFTLNCVVTVSSDVDTSVAVSVSWQSTHMSENPITSGGRVVISDVISTGSLMYQASLTLSNLSVSADSGAVYSCAASVSSRPASPYISTSLAATASIVIDVLVPVLVVSLAPSSVTVLDISPYNSFTLSCNSRIIMETVTATIAIEWSKQMIGSSITTVLSDNGASVNISNTAPDRRSIISQLTAVETFAGRYLYMCTASLQQPGDAPEIRNASATVTIQGPAVPTLPSNVRATVTTFTTATIEWDVHSIQYTPESYTLQYGTTQQLLDQSLEVAGSSDLSTLDQHYTVPLLGLQINTTYYYQITASNVVGSTSTIVLIFTIDDIPLITAITASGPSTAGETLTLTCTVTEEEDITGIPAVTWLDPAGQTIFSGGDFTVTSQLTGLTTTLTLQFAPLRSSHTGQYTCRAELNEIPYVETTVFTLSANVATLPVSIDGSSITYTAATPLVLTCQPGVGAVGSVMYRWSSTCTGECFVTSQTTAQVVSTALRAADSGQHTCTATDEVGNVGNSTIQITVEGVGIYLSGAGVLANNTVVLTSAGGAIGNVQCISGTTTPNVGQWIAPNGQDTTSSNTDPFDITVGGSENPGHLEISLAVGESITSSWEGVYTCRIPDEAGEEQVLYIGIHLTATAPSVVSLAPVSNSPSFTLICTSTGSAASRVLWRKAGIILDDGENYNMTQTLRDGVMSIFENILEVSSAVDSNSLAGNYSCIVENAFGISEISKVLTGIEILRDQDVFIVGQSASITCSSDLGVSSVEWINSDGIVFVSSIGSSAVLEFNPVSDFIHNTRYTCRTVAEFGTQERDVNIIVEVNPDDISVNITSSPQPAFIGQNLSVTCTVQSPTVSFYAPTIHWQYSSGIRIVNADDVSVRTEIFFVIGGSRSTVMFHPLSLMHGMDILCLVELALNAPPYHFSEAAEFDIVARNPAFPDTPADVAATEVTSTSAVIQWRIPSVTYTPEQYVVQYGTNRDVLVSESVTVQGNQDIALTNQAYSVSLSALSPDTAYLFRVLATNEIGTTNSEVRSFMTQIPGLAIPHAPFNVTIIEIMSTSTFVEWTVPIVSSSPEQYVVTYGTDQNSLTQISDPVQGLQDTSLVDQHYSVYLTSLLPNTTYYIRILAINSVGSASTELASFTTTEGDYMCTIHFQLLLGQVPDCSKWRLIDSREKVSDIRTTFVETFREKCRCSSIMEDNIQNAKFFCFENPQYVVFRATVSANLITYAHCDQFLFSLVDDRKETILVQSNRLSIDSDCTIVIDSLDEEFDCKPAIVSPGGLTDKQSNSIIGVVVGGVAGLVLISIVAVFIVTMVIRHRKRKLGAMAVTAGQAPENLMFENPCYLENNNPSSDIPKRYMTHNQPAQEDDSFVKMNPFAADSDDTAYSINTDGHDAEKPVGEVDEKQALEKAGFDGYSYY